MAIFTEYPESEVLETYSREPWDRDFFSQMKPSAQEAFDALKEPRSYRAGQIVYNQGEEAKGIYLLVSGELSVQRRCAKVRFQVLQILLPGDSVGIIPVIDGAPTACSVVAHTDASCWFLAANPLRRLAFENPEVGEAIRRHTCAKFRNLVSVLEGMSLHSVPERVAKLLLDQHRRNPSRSLLEFQEGEGDLAHFIGCSRSTFSRALRQLNDEGMIRNTFPVIRLMDLPKLEHFANCETRGSNLISHGHYNLQPTD